jgi:galactose-1-phosphate uridylyltransferase
VFEKTELDKNLEKTEITHGYETRIMKYITCTISIFILTISAQAQSVSYKMNAFYGFTHSSKYNTMYALNNNLETKLPSTRGDVILTIDSASLNMSLNDITNNKVIHYSIKKKEVLGDNTHLYIANYNEKDVTFTIFQNTPDEVQVLCVWVNEFNDYQGWQSVIVK